MKSLQAALIAKVLAGSPTTEMGPPGKIPEDARLDALMAHQQAVESTPESPKSPSLLQALLPLALAQGLDLVSTERFVGLNDKLNPAGLQMHTREGNPMPGMQSSGGRVGLALGELGLLAALLSKKPKLASKLINANTVMRTGLAFGNEQQRQEQLNYGGPYEDLRRISINKAGR